MPAPHISAEQLVQHQDWLFRMVRQLVRDDFTAEDMVQATMTEAIADDSAGSTNLRGWLGSTARRLTAQHWRSSARRGRREDRVGLQDEVVLQNSSELTEMFDIANRALYELPEEERVAVMMRHMQGLKPSAIAAETGVPLDEIYRNTENGTRKLRERLESRYGRDWRSSCLAILALPVVKKATISLVPLAASIAVCLTLLAGGFFAFDLFGEQVPEARLVSGGDPVAQASSSSSSAFESTAPERNDLPQFSQGPNGVHCQVLDPEGQPYASAKVVAIWKRGWVETTEGTTDRDGYLTLSPPEDAEDLRLLFGGHGPYGQSVPVPLASRGDLQVLRLLEGTIPVSFLASGAPAGEVIEVKGRAFFGLQDSFLVMCLTDEEGIARLNLPAAGQYRAVCQSVGNRLPSSSFHAGLSGILSPIPVSYEPQPPYRLVAKDSTAGHVLDQATYMITRFTKNGLVSRPISSDRGHLLLGEDRPLDFAELIHVRADGYQDIFAKFDAPVEGEIELPMMRLETVPATIHLMGTQRTIVSLTLFDACRVVVLPARDGIGPLQSSSAIPIHLGIEEDGSFLMPRAIGWDGDSFRFQAVDDAGASYSSDFYGPNDRIGTQLSFEIRSKQTGETTVAIHGTKPASTSVQYESSSIEQGIIPLHDAIPDESGILYFDTMPGTGIEIEYSAPDLAMTMRPQLPEGVDSGHFTCTIPDRIASLSGTMYGPDGQLLPDGSVFTAQYLETIPVFGPSDSEDATIEFYGEVIGGQAILENCPAGRYSIALFYMGLAHEQEVQTAEEFEMRFPDCHVVSLRIEDVETGAPLNVDLWDTGLMKPSGFPTQYQYTESGAGFFAIAFPMGYQRSHLVVAKWYYEPEIVSNPLSDDLTTVRLRPGRSARASLDDLGITLVDGNTWICDAWGDAIDPRQPLVRVGRTKITTPYAPRAAFHFLEVDADGVGTGRAILMHEDGSAELVEYGA